MRIRRVALCGVLLLATVACGDDPPEVAAESTSTTRRRSPTTRVVTTTTTAMASTTTAAAADPTTAPPTSAAPATPRVTSPPTAPAPTEPPPPPPPPNPNIQTVSAADLPHSWRPGCPVGPSSLRRILVTYRGFDGADHVGELIVHADWAEALLGVFAAIHAAGFAIERMESVDNYGASDDASMAANNTSAFNCRYVGGTTRWSRHAYGLAIDINPIQNPYGTCGGAADPPAGQPYLCDRSAQTGVITDPGPVLDAFASIGWPWGGHWTSKQDYQHFSDNGR